MRRRRVCSHVSPISDSQTDDLTFSTYYHRGGQRIERFIISNRVTQKITLRRSKDHLFMQSTLAPTGGIIYKTCYLLERKYSVFCQITKFHPKHYYATSKTLHVKMDIWKSDILSIFTCFVLIAIRWVG